MFPGGQARCLPCALFFGIREAVCRCSTRSLVATKA